MKKNLVKKMLPGAALLLLGLALLSRPAAEAEPDPELDPLKLISVTKDQTLLGEPGAAAVLRELSDIGQVMVIDQRAAGVPWLASAGVVMDAPAAAAYEAITDFEKVPEYMPQTEGARVKKLGPDFYDLEYDVVVRLVYIPIKAVFAIYQYNRPPLRTDWASKDPAKGLNYGYWELAPQDDGRTLGFYNIYTKANEGFIKRIYGLEPSLEKLVCLSTGMLAARATAKRAAWLSEQKGGPKPAARVAGNRTVVEVLREHPETVQYLAEKGRLLVLEEKDTVWSNVALVMDYPPERVWEWLADVSAQAETDPRVTATVVARDENTMRAKYNLEVYLVLSVKLEYELDYKLEKPDRITWDTVPGGDVQGVRGSWDLAPLAGGQKTLVLYRTTLDFRSMNFAIRALLEYEPTFELALQASQSLVAVDGMELGIGLTPEERRKISAEREKAVEESKDLKVPDAPEY